FYWMLKDAARNLTVGGKTLEECLEPIEKISRPVEKKHNLSALKSLSAWLKKEQIEQFFEAPSSSFVSPSEHITIKPDPASGSIKNEQRHNLNAWNSQILTLSKNVGSCGLHLMQQKLCVGDFADCVAGILDTRKREHFYGRAVPVIIPAMIASE